MEGKGKGWNNFFLTYDDVMGDEENNEEK